MKRSERYQDTPTFHYYNANPKNRLTCDCWLRAVCTGLNEPYNDVLKEMVEVHIETGYEMSSDKAIERYLEKKGWKKCKQPRKWDNSKYTGKEFCEQLQDDPYEFIGPKSIKNTRLIINIGGHHMAAIVDGQINDIWDSSSKYVGNYYIKK